MPSSLPCLHRTTKHTAVRRSHGIFHATITACRHAQCAWWRAIGVGCTMTRLRRTAAAVAAARTSILVLVPIPVTGMGTVLVPMTVPMMVLVPGQTAEMIMLIIEVFPAAGKAGKWSARCRYGCRQEDLRRGRRCGGGCGGVGTGATRTHATASTTTSPLPVPPYEWYGCTWSGGGRGVGGE